MGTQADGSVEVSERAAGAARGDDTALMEGVLARDPDALRQLYDKYSPTVMAVCVRVLRDVHEAEDVLVDIFQELWDKSDRYQSSRGNVAGYLMMLTRSRAIDRKRRQRIALPLSLNDSDTDAQVTTLTPADQSELVEERAKVVRALDALQPEHRRAIECAYYDGLSHSEIATRLGKPLGTVKTYIRQGMLKLRDALGAAQDR